MRKGLDRRVKVWYVVHFPSDDLGWEIRADVTFAAIDSAVDSPDGGDVYRAIGVGDSVIRERVFAEIDRVRGDGPSCYDRWVA